MLACETESDIKLMDNSISVCIATYERPQLLAAALNALARQQRMPDEIIISDASRGNSSMAIVSEFQHEINDISTIYCATNRRALPWQRWWAFNHSKGDVILFIDDDVQLTESAIRVLSRFYTDHGRSVAGVGFQMSTPDLESRVSMWNRIVGKWLDTIDSKPGTVTQGGISVSHNKFNSGVVLQVEWLWGGAMSFRRSVLEQIGPLENLYRLYDENHGKGEDGIISFQAGRYGPLYLIGGNYALHPSNENAVRSANPQEGFHKGILETWGRAHCFLWMSRSTLHWRIAWGKYACIELLRSARLLIISPTRISNWARVAGNIVGIYKTATHYIPRHPKDMANQ